MTGHGDPARGLRAVGAGLLVLEAIVVLFALLALPSLGHSPTGPGLGVILALVLGLVVVARLLGRSYGGVAGAVLQVLVFAAGILAWPLFFFGVIFGGMWYGYLRLMRDVRAG